MDDDLFLVERIGEGKALCLSTLARSTVNESEAAHLGGDRGYFIYEVDETKQDGVVVLAKAASLEAAYRLIDIWRKRTHQAALA